MGCWRSANVQRLRCRQHIGPVHRLSLAYLRYSRRGLACRSQPCLNCGPHGRRLPSMSRPRRSLCSAHATSPSFVIATRSGCIFGRGQSAATGLTCADRCPCVAHFVTCLTGRCVVKNPVPHKLGGLGPPTVAVIPCLHKQQGGAGAALPSPITAPRSASPRCQRSGCMRFREFRVFREIRLDFCL